jgi:NAD(P)-dependent dehydrogenase (short-subunit alcohol dehydrogenase family)
MADYFKNKVMIITGASSGTGKALALAAARQNALLVLAARNLPALKSVENLILSESYQDLNHDSQLMNAKSNHNPQITAHSSPKVLLVPCDVSREEDCRTLIENAVARFGRIDILVNNAGLSMRARFGDVDLNVMRRLIDVNFLGSVYCCRFALPHLLISKGSIVGVSSVAGTVGLPERSGYSASKFAMNGFLQSLRREYKREGLHVLVVSPGFTNTAIRSHAMLADGSAQGSTPLNEALLMSPEEVATRMLRAIRHHRRSLIMTGYGRLAVLLNKTWPALVDFLLSRLKT